MDTESEEEDCEYTEVEEEDEFSESSFNIMMGPQDSAVFDKAEIKYQRGSHPSQHTKQRKTKEKRNSKRLQKTVRF